MQQVKYSKQSDKYNYGKMTADCQSMISSVVKGWGNVNHPGENHG
ncbi:hypothetical protein [Virgibacillus ihumii]|nr:hypothetical protein [Virgibacillus ihumii]